MVEFARKALANTQGGLIALVSVVPLFWAVIRVFGSMERAFNNIWEVQSSGSWPARWEGSCSGSSTR